jgi:MFS transporter, MHS family, proline/betaine transporter
MVMAVDATIAGGYQTRISLRRVLIAATIGNVLEWFDFLVYGYFAVTIAEVFLPVRSPTVSLLITFAAFGLSYVMRPLGATFIGGYADRHGRKAGLTLSIAMVSALLRLIALAAISRRAPAK